MTSSLNFDAICFTGPESFEQFGTGIGSDAACLAIEITLEVDVEVQSGGQRVEEPANCIFDGHSRRFASPVGFSIGVTRNSVAFVAPTASVASSIKGSVTPLSVFVLFARAVVSPAVMVSR